MGLNSNKTSIEKLKKNSSLRYSFDRNYKGGCFKSSNPETKPEKIRFAFDEEGVINTDNTESNSITHKTVIKT